MKKRYLGLLALATILTSGLAVVNEHGFNKVDAADEATTISVTFSNSGYTNGQELTSITLDDVISLTLSKETGSSAPAYYNTGTAVRLYYKNSMTINVADGYKIEEINFTVGSGNKFTSPKVENGQMSNASSTTPAIIPTDGTQPVKVTQNPSGSSGHVRISSMSVKYSVVSGGAPEIGDNPQKELNTLVQTYFNKGVYTKATEINVSDGCVDDLAQYFHGKVQLDRTTYFNKNELWMTGEDINSGYGTVTTENLGAVRKVNPNAEVGDMTHFKYLNNNQKYDYSVSMPNKGGMEEFYITLSDLTDYSYFAEGDWTYENGAYYHTVTDKVSDSYLLDFLAIAAPCLEDSALSNYFTVSQLVVKEDKDNESLKLQILLDARTVEGKLDVATNVLAEAILTAGCDEEFGYVNPSQTYNCTFAKSNFTIASDNSTAGGTTTLNNISWTYTDSVYLGFTDTTKGMQVGKSAANEPSFVLSTSYFADNNYKINSIVVNSSIGKDGDGTLTIQVGDTVVLDSQSLTTTATDYVATVSELTGDVSITLSAGAKAMYIKSITVYYTEE